jgi:tetratricopeptide (TPR) repeat protein
VALQLEPGTEFAGYLIEDVLGRGGMGVVYRAKQVDLDRPVALKVVAPELAENQDFRERFKRESRLAAQIDHPNVVPVYEAGEHEGQLFIGMRFVDGTDLKALIAWKGRLAPTRAAAIVAQVAAALDAAHERGLIHRDVKPANVLITSAGEQDHAYLTDFGLMKDTGSQSGLTRSGAWVGTLDYVAPEQIQGEAIDARADVYSLGCVLYEALTGQLPYQKEGDVSKMWAHVSEPPPVISAVAPDLPPSLDAVIERAMAKERSERYPSAGDLGRAVLAAVEGVAAAEPERSVAQGAAAPKAPPAAPGGATITDEPAAEAVDWQVPLPSSIGDVARQPFVGRQEATDALRGHWDLAREGRRQLVLVGGEPGIGKTRLVSELCRAVHEEDGATVLFGRCYEESLVPYQPFIGALRPYVTACPPEELRTRVTESGVEITTLLPEVAERLPGLPEPVRADPEAERYRLFEAMGGLLAAMSQETPLTLVLDDLHWADQPTLLLLKHIARSPEQSPMLIVGTYRETDLARTHPLSDTLADLRREHLFERVSLKGLGEEEVAALVEGWAGHEAPEDFVRALSGETEGNPFFIEEVLQHLAESGAIYQEEGRWTSDLSVEEIGIPEGVKEVIGRRLSRLGETANKTLSLASVVGRTFGLDLLERVSEHSEDELLEGLEEAADARVIEELPKTVGRYSFSHALIRETLYEELSATRRVRLHRKVAEALEALHADDLGPHFAGLAYHFMQGAPAGTVEQAIDYSLRAGQRAIEQLAYEEAAGIYQRALSVLEPDEPDQESRRCALLLALGDAQSKAGNIERSREAFVQAAAIARKLDSPEELALAALGVAGRAFQSFGLVDDERIELLEEALEALGSEDSALRARVTGSLAEALYFSPSGGRTLPLGEAAVEMARRVGDETALAYALNAYAYGLWQPDHLEKRLEVGTELAEVAERIGEPELVLHGLSWRLGCFLEAGEIAAVDRERELHTPLAEEVGQPFYLLYDKAFQTMRALIDGRFEAAEQAAGEALEFGQAMHEPADSVQMFGVHMFLVLREQGRMDELEDAMRDFADGYPAVPAWRAGLGALLVELGKDDDARAELERLAANDFADIPRDANWFIAAALLSEMCHRLADVRRAALLYDLLLPYPDRIVVTGAAVGCFGPLSHYLGLLGATLGRPDDAARHFEAALEMNAALSSPAWAARTQLAYARALLEGDGNGEKAVALLAEAERTASELGMTVVSEAAAELAARAKAPASTP